MAVITGASVMAAPAEDCPPGGGDGGGDDGGAGAFITTVWAAKDCPPAEEKAPKEDLDLSPAEPPGPPPTATMTLVFGAGQCFPADGELITDILGRGIVKKTPVKSGQCTMEIVVEVPFADNWIQIFFQSAGGTQQLHVSGEGPCPTGTCGSIAAGQDKGFVVTFP